MVSCRQVRIQMLGDFRLLRDGEPILTLGSNRVQALLAFLALHRGAAQSRAHVASLFWPDSSEEQSLTNLRHLFHELRKTLPETDAFIQADNRSLCWSPGAPVWLDVLEFEQLHAAAEDASRRGQRLEAGQLLAQAAQLYAGDLLPACTHEWVLTDRERLRREFASVLQQLIQFQEDTRDYDGALRNAERLQRLEPTHEATYCTLMRLNLIRGDRSAALNVYRRCVDVLRRELAVGPGSSVRAIYERVLANEPIGEAAPPASHSTTPGTLPLHGRTAEWQRLRAAWDEAAKGRAQLAVIVGDAGIGKSRLAEELCLWFERQGGLVARSRSYAAEGRLAFAPAADWLRTAALRSSLAKVDPVWRAEIAHVLPELRLEQPLPPTRPDRETSQRHRLFEALCRGLLAAEAPTLLSLDDMQWTDLESLEWLRFLLRFAPGAPLLIVGTLRSEELTFDHPLQRLFRDLRRDGQLADLPLGPLSAADAALVAADVAKRPLNEGEAAWLYRETEGNPLFVVESVRAGLQDTNALPAEPRRAGDAAPLPPKVHAVITTRIAQLSSDAREAVAAAAVIGRDFDFELLALVCGRSEEELVAAVDELWQRRILAEQGPGRYDFTHDKLREVTYAELSAPRRHVLHRRAAEALARLHPADPEAVSARIGAHFEAAGRPVHALAAYRQAADAAKRVHADEEAIRLYQKALGLIEALPATTERAVQALELNTALGVCLVASHGYPDPGVIGIYERAIALCQQLGRPIEPPILRAHAIASLTSGNTRRAEVLGHELLAAFARSGEPVVQVEGHYVLGVSYFWMARFAESRTHLEQAIACFDPKYREIHWSLYAQDPKAVCLCRLAWTLSSLGYPDQARQRLDEALRLARELRHPHTAAYVFCFGAAASLQLRDEEGAERLLDSLDELTARHRLFFWENRGKIFRCLIRAERTGEQQAFAEARDYMAAYVQVGNVVNLSEFLGLTARALLVHGRLSEGLRTIEAAFAQLEHIDERYYVPELHRLRGELLRAQGAARDDVEASFRRSIDLAREQGARTAELRGAISWGKLLFSLRKRREARDLLATVYAGFTEGFDSADLRDARELLERWA